jgi:hypothetical protein
MTRARHYLVVLELRRCAGRDMNLDAARNIA